MARIAGLDQPLVETLWRRHGLRSNRIVSQIIEDPHTASPLSDRIDYCAAEIAVMAEAEQIVDLEDFLRRRTLLAQVERHTELMDDPGLATVSRLLFGTAPN